MMLALALIVGVAEWSSVHCTPARSVPMSATLNITRLVVESGDNDVKLWNAAHPSHTPRLANADACSGACYPVYALDLAPSLTPNELGLALTLAGWEPDAPDTRTMYRLISTCEDTTLTPGIVSYTGEAFGLAQLRPGWFDVARVPFDAWPYAVANLRVAKVAHDDAVSRGLPPFVYWSCK